MLIVFRQSKERRKISLIERWKYVIMAHHTTNKKVKKERKKYTHLHICQCRKWYWGQHMTHLLLTKHSTLQHTFCCLSTCHFEPILPFIFKAQADLTASLSFLRRKWHVFMFFQSPKQTNKVLQLTIQRWEEKSYSGCEQSSLLAI